MGPPLRPRRARRHQREPLKRIFPSSSTLSYRVLGNNHSFCLEIMDGSFHREATRAWLDRGQQCCNRVPLGRSTQRTIRSNRVRVRPANVDVIVTGGNAALAVKQTTSAIPIIFVLAVDPVRMGLHSAGLSVRMYEPTDRRNPTHPIRLDGAVLGFLGSELFYPLHSVFLLPHDTYDKRKLPTTKSSSET